MLKLGNAWGCVMSKRGKECDAEDEFGGCRIMLQLSNSGYGEKETRLGIGVISKMELLPRMK